MKEFQVKLGSIDSVKTFVNIATLHQGEIDVTSERYVVDGKSMLGLFSLDLSRPVGVKYFGEDSEAEEFYNQVKAVLEIRKVEEGK